MKTAWALALALGATACGGKAKMLGNIGVAATAAPVPLPRIGKPPDPSPPGVDEHVILTVGERMIGPFLARRGEAVLAAYIGNGEAGGRRVVALPIAANGEPRGEARVAASVPADATMLVVRPTGGERSAYVAAWTSLTDRGEALSVVGIGEDGRPRALPAELGRTTDHIVWVDVVPTSRGAIAVWAEETQSADASILAVALAPDGAMRGVPARVARGVMAWQIVGTRDGAALALVTPTEARSRDKKRTGALAWMRLDASGAVASTTPITPGGVGGDMDVVRAGDGYIFAWTDTSEPDPHVALAGVDDRGAVRAPARGPEGAGSLVRIASGPAGVALAWEDPLRRAKGMRRVHLARIEGGSVDAKTVAALDLAGRGSVDLTGAPGGFALLAPARACWQKDCADAPTLPTMVRFDTRMAMTQIEPMRLGPVREPASLTWGLTCGAEECLALATAADEEPRVRTVDIRPRMTAFRPPIASDGPSDAPHVESVSTLGVGAFADVAAARVGDGSLVALLGAALDVPAKRRVPASGATLAVRPLGPSGTPSGPAVTITKRALTVGGVAIAPAGRVEDGAAVVWVAPEDGDPQVHAARVDRTGKRVRDRQITTQKGDASDVAVAWAGDGWIIAWVDARDGNGEVYVTKVDRDLRRVVKDTRVTRAPGDASDIAILARPDAVWLAWADPRESPADGFADIYVTQLRPSDASRLGPESRVLATAAHSRSPALAAAGDQVAVAWIEEAPLGADSATAQAYGAMMAWLDPQGRPLREAGRLATAGDGFATAVTMDGSPSAVHVVLARSARESIDLDAIEVTRDPVQRPYALLGLDGPPSLDVSFTLLGDALYFNDEGQDPTDRRARRARVTWRR